MKKWSIFYHPKTESELVSLRQYLIYRRKNNTLDYVDSWIQMVATNRLTGHSTGFFSVYTPPKSNLKPRKTKTNKQKAESKTTL